MQATTVLRGTQQNRPKPEVIINDQTLIFTSAPDCVAQGDLYIVAISKLPKSARPRKDRQLAEGTTQGSRHVCTTGDVFEADRSDISALIRAATGLSIEEQYIGPLFTGPAYISHPEHGDHDFQCEGVFAVVFQMVLDAQLRRQRVQD